MKNLTIISFSLILIFLSSCATVPFTGRKQVSLHGEKQLSFFAEQQYRQLVSEYPLCSDAETNEMVHRVARNVINAAKTYYHRNGLSGQLKHFQWEVNVLESDVVNALCMPGGKIIIYTGILEVTENEDGLAFILGHEVAHALAKHANERISHGQLLQVGGVLLSEALKDESQSTQDVATVGYQLGATFGLMLPFSRNHEKEADEIGQNLMAIAGYNPYEASKVWQRMNDMYGGTDFAFFSTHPTHDKRCFLMHEHVEEAMAYARQYNPKFRKNQPVKVEPKVESPPVVAYQESPFQQPSSALITSIFSTTSTAVDAKKLEKKSEPEVQTTSVTTVVEKEKAVETKERESTEELALEHYKATSFINRDYAEFSTNAPRTKDDVYKIELGKAHHISNKKLDRVRDKGRIDTEHLEKKNQNRLMLGDFHDLETAKKILRYVQGAGFNSIRIIKYHDGNRIEKYVF